MKGFLVTHTSHHIHAFGFVEKKHGVDQFPSGGFRD